MEAIERLIEARRKHADAWGTLDRDTLDLFRDVFKEIDGQGKRILEIGSGNGFTCVLFGLLGAGEVEGLEIVGSAVAVAEDVKRDIAPDLPVFFRQGNAAEPLPFENDSFDALLLVEVVSHILTDDISGLLREMVRVVRPGGLVYLQDGNNARSWKRRHDNYEIWKRFELGPSTGPGETVHTHRIGKPYVDRRREIARAAAPSLTEAQAGSIAENTFALDARQVREAAQRFVESGEMPQSPYRPRVCPVEPFSAMFIEQLIDPMVVRRDLRALGCDVIACRARRRLPFNSLWIRFPALTLRLSNGFTIVARRSSAAGSGSPSKS